MIPPISEATHSAILENGKQPAVGKLNLRDVKVIPTSADSVVYINTNTKGGISCYALGMVIIVVGAVMYGVANNSCTDLHQICNVSLLEAGTDVMIIGGLLAISSCVCGIFSACCR